MPPLHLYARVRTFLCTLRTRPRVQRAPGIPCSLFFRGRTFRQTSGRSCREIAKLYLDLTTSLRGALATKQSILSLRDEMDCFVASLLAMTVVVA
jgi:hypothetical protein